MSGIWYDYVEKLGDKLGLEIDWSLEVGLGDLIEAIKFEKVDAYCASLWNNPARAKHIDFTTPISYQVLFAYAREEDNRFDNNPHKINNENITVSCIDGEMADLIAQADFPKAKRACLPQLTPYSAILTNVSVGKADLTFASPVLIKKFNENNPQNKLKQVKSKYPVRTFSESIALKYGEHSLRRLLDHGTTFMIDSGEVDDILKEYETEYGNFYRTTKPYEVPK